MPRPRPPHPSHPPNPGPAPSRAPDRGRRPAGTTRRRFPELPVVAVLLLLHACLLGWGIARNSVTFDENFHLASGVAAVTRGDFWISVVNPPLVKECMALAALAAGAQPPPDSALVARDQFIAGEAFMRANAAHYHRVFAAARCVTAALSIALAVLIWRFTRRRYGVPAGVFALALYSLIPDVLAHGGLATLDIATTLLLFAGIVAYLRFARSGAWRDLLWLALVVAAAFATRFSAWLLLLVLAGLTVPAIALRAAPRPGRLVAGVVLLLPVALLALHLAYGGHGHWRPLAQDRFDSASFRRLEARWPHLVLPLPEVYLAGLDHQALESQGIVPTYVFGRATLDPVPWYPWLAIAVKWPLALWGAFVAALVAWLSTRRRVDPAGRRERRFETLALLALPVALIATLMFAVRLNVGVRYLLPALPPLIVLTAGTLLPPGNVPRRRLAIAIAIAGLALAETAFTAPWYLAFFNAIGGGPGNGDHIVNDSNADLGQGLIALREDLARLGVRRVYLAYHGSTDPAVYGIDYIPYLGGMPGSGSDWLAVSSYYFVGLNQRMMTQRGRTPFVQLDFHELADRPPAARPARCMYLFRIR